MKMATLQLFCYHTRLRHGPGFITDIFFFNNVVHFQLNELVQFKIFICLFVVTIKMFAKLGTSYKYKSQIALSFSQSIHLLSGKYVFKRILWSPDFVKNKLFYSSHTYFLLSLFTLTSFKFLSTKIAE